MTSTITSVGAARGLQWVLRCALVLCLAVLALQCCQRVGAEGSLMVYPTRIVFEGEKRTASLNLVNNGDAPVTYRISLVRRRMAEDGSVSEVIEPLPGERFADDMVRFTHRQVRLAPRTSQTVRLQLRKPAELAKGEYRSHLLFSAVPTDEPTTSEPGAAGVKLTAVFGISIPVIVRHGMLNAVVAMSDMSFSAPSEPGGRPQLTVRLNRTGDESVYGDLHVRWSVGGKDAVIVGMVRGLAVYTPNAGRVIKIALSPPPGVTIANGTLQIAYSDSEHGDVALASGSVDVP